MRYIFRLVNIKLFIAFLLHTQSVLSLYKYIYILNGFREFILRKKQIHFIFKIFKIICARIQIFIIFIHNTILHNTKKHY